MTTAWSMANNNPIIFNATKWIHWIKIRLLLLRSLLCLLSASLFTHSTSKFWEIFFVAEDNSQLYWIFLSKVYYRDSTFQYTKTLLGTFSGLVYKKRECIWKHRSKHWGVFQIDVILFLLVNSTSSGRKSI